MKIRSDVEVRVVLKRMSKMACLASLGILWLNPAQIALGEIAPARTSPVELLYSFPFALLEHHSKQPISLIKARNGTFYGTTIGDALDDFGSIFSISEDGTFTTLYRFTDPTTGDFPIGQLVEGTDGNFYGTTAYGGLTFQGTAYRMSPDGAFTVLHNFGSDPSDGTNPVGGFVQAADGNFYGTTFNGGANGVGTVYRMTSQGAVTILHNFALNQIPTGGAHPNGQTLTLGRDALLYGVTQWNPDSTGDYGTVFRISTNGRFKVLHRFEATTGYEPVAPLFQASDGNFYGTTQLGGETDGSGLTPEGTIFRMTPRGRVTFLHTFYLPPKDGTGHPAGSAPTNQLVEGEDGAFYSTITGCDNFGDDCIFRTSRSGEFSDLYDFTPQEARSAGPLILGNDGFYYSFSQFGGINLLIRGGSLFRTSLPH